VATSLQKRIFVAAALIAGAAEGVVIYQQWPTPPLKVCASAELGGLVAVATRTEAALREARSGLRTGMGESVVPDVLRLEEASAAAWNEVAAYKQRVLDRQKASGETPPSGACI
jgi:hypothetical protein